MTGIVGMLHVRLIAVFDRILDRDDMLGRRLAEPVHEGGQGGRLTGTGRPGDQTKAGPPTDRLSQRSRGIRIDSQYVEGRYLIAQYPAGDTQSRSRKVCLDPQASRNLAPIGILHPIGRKIVYPGFLEALERTCNLIIRATGVIISTKPMTGFFLPTNQFLVNLQEIAIREESQEIKAFHPMVGLNVDRALGAKLNIGNTASLAGLKRDREKVLTGHAWLEDPQLRGLRQDRRLLGRTHGELKSDL